MDNLCNQLCNNVLNRMKLGRCKPKMLMIEDKEVDNPTDGASSRFALFFSYQVPLILYSYHILLKMYSKTV
jgi:hypothetical protein